MPESQATETTETELPAHDGQPAAAAERPKDLPKMLIGTEAGLFRPFWCRRLRGIMGKRLVASPDSQSVAATAGGVQDPVAVLDLTVKTEVSGTPGTPRAGG